MIGNGEKIFVWQCRWIPCKNGFREPLSNITDSNLTVSDLWDVDKRWNINLIKNHFNNQADVEDTSKTYIPRCLRRTQKFGLSAKRANLPLNQLTMRLQKVIEIIRHLL